MLSYSSEENGVTTLRFYRKRDTNDQQNDVVIQVKRVVIKLYMDFSDEGCFCFFLFFFFFFFFDVKKVS